MKNEEIPPFATTWMALEGILLSEINQTEKEKYHVILHVESQEKILKRTYRKRVQNCGYERQRMERGKLEEDGQKTLTSSYKISKYQQCNVQHDAYS